MKKTTTITIIDETTAIVTKKFYSQAMKYGTEEYKLMREFKAENPEITIVVRKIKKNPEKETNKNMTYANMKKFIKTQPNSDAMLKEFDRQKEMSCIKANPYRFVLDWFKENYLISEEATANFNAIVPTEKDTTTPAYQA